MPTNNWNKKTRLFLEELGYVTEKLEHWCAFSNRRKDFMGFGDVMAINPKSKFKRILTVQNTSRTNVTSRVHKITDMLTKEGETNLIREKAIQWLKAGAGILIIGFDDDKLKNRAGRFIEIYLDKKELKYRELTSQLGVKNA
jgi:hypothetical protein